MKINMGTLDRRMRLFAITPALVAAGVMVGPSNPAAVVLYAVAAVMGVTSLVGNCPLYSVLGIKTCPADRSRGKAGAS